MYSNIYPQFSRMVNHSVLAKGTRGIGSRRTERGGVAVSNNLQIIWNF